MTGAKAFLVQVIIQIQVEKKILYFISVVLKSTFISHLEAGTTKKGYT